MVRNLLILSALLACASHVEAQANDPAVLMGRGPFSHADSLRGQVSKERAAIDVTHYGLDVRVVPEQKSIIGSVVIDFVTVAATQRLQFDLYSNMMIDTVILMDGNSSHTIVPQRDGNTFYLDLPSLMPKGKSLSVRVMYHGVPQEAKNPPWDGGFVWAKDSIGNPLISVACEGAGASLWWPCKDEPSDEPDSITTRITWIGKGFPVANGRLIKVEKPSGNTAGIITTWLVKNPINLYNVNITIGDFAHIHDVYKSEVTGDTLSLDYYVMKANEEQAHRFLSAEVKPMLDVFEKHFGPYPWYGDGYKLVETPYWGMEHQSSIAYGNDYQRLPAPFSFDFIIVHESGHEWFGNSISMADGSDMWLHETFTAYSEWVYLEALRSKEVALQYRQAVRQYIENKEPIQGPRGVNYEGWEGSDMYYKGAWMLHTLRSHVGREEYSLTSSAETDQWWWDLIRKYYTTFKGKVIYTEDAVDFFAKELGEDVRPIFQQYLNYAALPVLEYQLTKGAEGKLAVRWRFNSPVKDFALNLRYKDGPTWKTKSVSTEWQTQELVYGAADFEIDTDNQLIDLRNLTGN
jgi:aminopeptidase N